MKRLTPAEIMTKIIDYSKMTYPAFAKAVGRNSPQYLRDITKGVTKVITPKVADEVTKRFPEISRDWMLTGNGNMFVDEMKQLEMISERSPNYMKKEEIIQMKHEDYMEVEYRDLSVSAGALTRSIGGQRQTILVPREFDRGDYLVVRVGGPSMDDGTKYSIPEGAEILIKRFVFEGDKKLPIRDNLFVIDCKDGQMLKQITEYNLDEGYIVCHSYNKEYSDFKIQLDDVIAFYVYRKIVGYRPPVRDIKPQEND